MQASGPQTDIAVSFLSYVNNELRTQVEEEQAASRDEARFHTQLTTVLFAGFWSMSAAALSLFS